MYTLKVIEMLFVSDMICVFEILKRMSDSDHRGYFYFKNNQISTF